MSTDTQDVTLLDVAESKPSHPPAARYSGALSASPTPSDLLRIAIETGADLDRLERLMALQEKWEASEARKAYNVAFAAFKSEAVQIVRGRTVTNGPLTGRSYAELHDVVDAVTPALSRHGLSAAWRLSKDEKDWLEVTCSLKHVGGHSESVSMGGPPDQGGAKNALQARASTKTYLERYTLKAICGIAEGGEDDDGDGGAGKRAPIITPRGGIGNDLPEDWKIYLRDLAQTINQLVQAGDVTGALHAIAKDNLEDDQRVFLENHLDSKVRSALKKGK